MFSQRIVRLPWLLGILILIVSLVGAAQIFQGRNVEAGPQDQDSKRRTEIGTGVVCLGRVDVESGLVPLFPHQPGAVTDLFCFEGQPVKKGEPLLKVQETPFRLKFAEAESAVAQAETLLAQAKQALARFPETVSQQQHALEARRSLLASQEKEFERMERLRKANIPQYSEEDYQSTKLKIQGLREAVAAEEAKLREVEKSQPDEKVNEAQKGVEVRKKQADQAKEALDRCTLTAPQDGTILQVQASIGTQFGPQSHTAALTFAPNGARVIRLEVDQEFVGRITMGATATIQDESNVGPTWTGKVVRIADAFLPRRPSINGSEVLTTNNENRTLEVLVSIDSAAVMPRLGQKMRASIGGANAVAVSRTS
ncbi:MAG: HlyD family secretion protein [Gemmataceae bacterium]